jgi:ferredoxin
VSTRDSACVELPARTVNGRARAAALRAHRRDSAGVGTVAYRSQGNLLIIAGESGEQAASCARALTPALHCVLLSAPGVGQTAGRVQGVPRLEGYLGRLEGYLGRFSVSVECDGQNLNPAQLFDSAGEHVDLILDLGDPPTLPHEVPPPGYYAPRDRRALERSLKELRELLGEFEKPRFFDYDPDICAHGRSGLAGCRRCLDACPTLAIRSLGERIEVDAHLCQGGGGCASACPTGAIRYAYPGVSVLLTSVREALNRYRGAGGADAQVMFFDAASGQKTLEALAERLPESVLPFQVEELGSLGMDTWLATLAYGARRIVLFTTQSIPRSVLREVSLQISYARAVLSGMGYRRDCLELVLNADHEGTLAESLGRELPSPAIAPAGFMAFDEKRTTLNLAIDHLYAQAPEPRPVADLPDDAPFGTIDINPRRCTLCMACVAVCPSRALYAGDERPALQFIENNCVQCGLCHAACPEDAVRLVPRLNFDRAQSRNLRTLHEEQPFRCVRCGKPFATTAVVERMTERLADHWMFRDARARRRIQMCQDCKTLDMFEQEEKPNVYDKPPADS